MQDGQNVQQKYYCLWGVYKTESRRYTRPNQARPCRSLPEEDAIRPGTGGKCSTNGRRRRKEVLAPGFPEAHRSFASVEGVRLPT